MQLKNMLVTGLGLYTLVLQAMEPPVRQIMTDNDTQQYTMQDYKLVWQSGNAPESPPAKKQTPLSLISEEKQEYTHASSQEMEHIVKVCDLAPVCRLNKEGDPLIKEYEQRDTITKIYPKSACLAFFAHIKKAETLTIPVCNATTYANGSAESATHRGVVSSSYFFSSQQYFCTISLKQANGQFMPPRYLDDATFGALYTLFQEQETERKRLAQLQSKRHTYLEKKLRAVARKQRKKDLISCQTSIHTG